MNRLGPLINFMKQKMAQAPGAKGGGPSNSSVGGLGAILVLTAGAYGAYNSLVTIQPGHQGFIYNRFGGIDEKSVLTEGINFVLPWFQRAVVYDIRTRPQPIDTQSGSKGN